MHATNAAHGLPWFRTAPLTRLTEKQRKPPADILCILCQTYLSTSLRLLASLRPEDRADKRAQALLPKLAGARVGNGAAQRGPTPHKRLPHTPPSHAAHRCSVLLRHTPALTAVHVKSGRADAFTSSWRTGRCTRCPCRTAAGTWSRRARTSCGRCRWRPAGETRLSTGKGGSATSAGRMHTAPHNYHELQHWMLFFADNGVQLHGGRMMRPTHLK